MGSDYHAAVRIVIFSKLARVLAESSANPAS
jgi:hypothetical protein